MKTIYLLLSRSRTLLSRAVYLMTGDEYTHISIAFDPELETLCSMARYDARFPLPAGLVRESPGEGYFGAHPDVRCALLGLDVPDEIYDRARARAGAMLGEQEAAGRSAWRYSVLGLFACRMGVAWTRPGRMFCSQFVGTLLRESGALAPEREPSLMRPQDFFALPGARMCFRGRMEALARGGLTATGEASPMNSSSAFS